jgi:hypothetical protein
MKKIVWRYGGFAVLIVTVYFISTWLMFSLTTPNFGNVAVLNWIGIVLCLVFVFVGILTYRNDMNYGELRFKEGLVLGLLIAILPAVAFGLLDALFVSWLYPSFFDKYYAWKAAQVQSDYPATEWAARLKSLEQKRKFFGTAYGQLIVMTLTVYIIGAAIAALSALVLKRKTGNRIRTAAHPAY